MYYSILVLKKFTTEVKFRYIIHEITQHNHTFIVLFSKHHNENMILLCYFMNNTT